AALALFDGRRPVLGLRQLSGRHQDLPPGRAHGAADRPPRRAGARAGHAGRRPRGPGDLPRPAHIRRPYGVTRGRSPGSRVRPSVEVEVFAGEVDGRGHLADALLHDQGAVARVVAVDLVLPAQLAQAGQVVVDLADRAARVVLPGHDQDRRGDLLDV